MTMPVLALVLGLALLVWSADRFVDGAAATARYLGMPPLLIGMVIIGFGTSAPEMTISVFAAWQGNPGVALGNAYGSNIANIALILGFTALISPLSFHSKVLRQELPILTAVTVLAAFQLWDGNLTRTDAWVLLAAFCVLFSWTIYEAAGNRGDRLSREIEEVLSAEVMSRGQAVLWLVVGLVVLIVSSRVLVWGAVEVARGFGISDLVIGLTVVAIGTSLPELASAIAAARKGEHDMALGNVVGSNMFNTLLVVGVAGALEPMVVQPEVLTRDVLVMGTLTVSLFVIGHGFRGRPGRINRVEGAVLVSVYVAYLAFLAVGVVAA